MNLQTSPKATHRLGSRLRHALAVAAAPVSFCASAQNPSQWIINPEPAYQDLFGISTRWVGDIFAVGTMWDKVGNIPKAGAVYLYDTSSTSGNLGPPLVKLQSPSPVSGGEFGGSLATVGTVLAVGSAWGGLNWFRPGAVYLYDGDRSSASFGAFLGTPRNPRPNVGDEFGFSVVPVGNNLLVGAYADGSRAARAGAAYLFNVNRSSADFGKLIATFENPVPGVNDYFGVAATAVGEGRIAIGAFRDDTAGVDAGAVYLFDAQPSSATFGALLHTFVNPRPSPRRLRTVRTTSSGTCWQAVEITCLFLRFVRMPGPRMPGRCTCSMPTRAPPRSGTCS